MGSYASIMGEELKVTGLLIKAAKEIGIEEDKGLYLFNRDEVQQVLARMIRDLQGERQLVDVDKVSASALYKLEAEAHMAGALIDWLVNSQEEQIFFG